MPQAAVVASATTLAHQEAAYQFSSRAGSSASRSMTASGAVPS